MTIEEFAAVTERRIPTPAEFVAFVGGQPGWRVVLRPDGRGALRVPDPADPLAVSLARMLGREPWRTEVLRLVAGPATPGTPSAAGPEPATARSDPPGPPPGPPAPPAATAGADDDVVASGLCRCPGGGRWPWLAFPPGDAAYRWELRRARLSATAWAEHYRVYAGADWAVVPVSHFRRAFVEVPP